MEVFGHCLHPKRVFNKYTHEVEVVPCGECEACLNAKSSLMTARVEAEIKYHRYSIFFTLTYDNDSCPRCEVFEDSHGVLQTRPLGRIADSYRYWPLYHRRNACSKLPSLTDAYIPHIVGNDVIGEYAVCSKYDIQCFIKRIRKNISKFDLNDDEKKFRYYIASEYGPETFRPHYHGLFVFDSPKLLSLLSANIVDCWGVWERQSRGKVNDFVFRPFARPDLTRQHIKLCDVGTAWYVASYVSSNSRLPLALRHPLFRPFCLCSKGPCFGSCKTDVQKMLWDVSRGVITHGVTKNDYKSGTSEVIVVPYTQGDLGSIFRKCRSYRNLSAYAKSCLYSFCYDRYSQWQSWVKTSVFYSASGLPVDVFCRINPEYRFRSYCETYHSDWYSALEMDCDTNWYASMFAMRCVEKYPIFGKIGIAHPIDAYLHLMSEGYRLTSLYRLGMFYKNLNEWLTIFGPYSVFSAYPRLSEYLPFRVEQFCHVPVAYRGVLVDLDLYRSLYDSSGWLDVVKVSSYQDTLTPFFLSYADCEIQKFNDKDKSKKKNNKAFNGVRLLD